MVQDLINTLKDFKKDKVAIILPIIQKSSYYSNDDIITKNEDDEPPLKRKFSRETIVPPEIKVRKDKKPLRKPSKPKLISNTNVADKHQEKANLHTHLKQEQDEEEEILFQQTLEEIKEEESGEARQPARSNKGQYKKYDDF